MCACASCLIPSGFAPSWRQSAARRRRGMFACPLAAARRRAWSTESGALHPVCTGISSPNPEPGAVPGFAHRLARDGPLFDFENALLFTDVSQPWSPQCAFPTSLSSFPHLHRRRPLAPAPSQHRVELHPRPHLRPPTATMVDWQSPEEIAKDGSQYPGIKLNQRIRLTRVHFRLSIL